MPTLIQPHRSRFTMQFPEGVKAEVDAGRGKAVRLDAKATWYLWAAAQDNGSFAGIGPKPYAQTYANGQPVVSVTVTETTDGPYWGWLDRRHGIYDAHPSRIQPTEDRFRIQFAQSPEAKQTKNRGRLLRLAITAALH
jgi:hypothetical protein